jgi:hypothetical protein
MKDEFNRADLIERQLRKKSAKARIGGVFRNMDHGEKEFNKIKQVFGCDVKIAEKPVKIFPNPKLKYPLQFLCPKTNP